MSFAMTTAQIQAGTKTVTRRFGWWFLLEIDFDQVEYLVRPVYKGMGLQKGEKVRAIRAPIQIVHSSREPLADITQADVIMEGFPAWSPNDYVAFMCAHNSKTTPATLVNRIEFKYADWAAEGICGVRHMDFMRVIHCARHRGHTGWHNAGQIGWQDTQMDMLKEQHTKGTGQ